MLSLLTLLAQTSGGYYDYEYNYSSDTLTDEEAAAATLFGFGLLAFMLVLFLVFYVFTAICLMKIFKKAGRQDAWAAWIPIYNMYVYYEVAGRPGWWAFLGLIPFVGGLISLVTIIIGSIDMAKSFGKEVGYGLLLAFVPIIGYPMLAFGSAEYQGPAGPEGNKPQVPPTTTPPTAPTAPTPPNPSEPTL